MRYRSEEGRRHMVHGVKGLPRMGNYISHRLKEDM